MENRILEVFYGTDGKPYKDQERSVLFPVVGNEYQGANDFTHIRFYYQRLCGEDNTLVAVFKNAKGELGCKPLSTSTDSTRGEKYALLPISDFLTQYKGDIYIALQCYRGDDDAITWDSDNNMWVLNTQVPTIRSTAYIKMSVNYTPLIIGGGEEELLTLQVLLSYIAEKADIDDVVIVFGDISGEDLSGYDVGQLFYDNDTHTYYQKTDTSPYYTKALSGAGVLGAPHILCRSDDDTRTIAQLHTIYGDSAYIVLRYLNKDYLYFSKKVGSTYTCVAFDTEEQRFYKASGLSGSALPSAILVPANKIEIASKALLVSNYVPYSGANSDVHLNGHHLYGTKVYTDHNGENHDSFKASLEEEGISNVAFVLKQNTEIEGGEIDDYQYAYFLNENATLICGGLNYRKLTETESDIYYACLNGSITPQTDGTSVTLGRVVKISKTSVDGVHAYTESDLTLDLYSKDQAKAKFGTSLALELNNTNYKLVAKLYNANGGLIDTSNEIDLPLESIVSSATYYDTYTYEGVTYTKVIVITLSTTSVPTIVPVGDLISGLEKEACVEIDELSGTFTQEQMQTLALDNASIKFNGRIYHKVTNSLFNSVEVVANQEQGQWFNFVLSYAILVTPSTREYEYVEKFIQVYNKDEIDAKVGDLQDGIDANAHDIDTLEGDVADIQGDLETVDERLDNHDTDIAKLKKDVDYAMKYPLIYGTPTTDTEEEVGLTTSQLPATTLPKGLINYVGGMSQKVNQLITDGNFQTQEVWKAYNSENIQLAISNSKARATFLTSTDDPSFFYSILVNNNYEKQIKASHKYFVRSVVYSTKSGDFGFEIFATYPTTLYNVSANTLTTIERIGNPVQDRSCGFFCGMRTGSFSVGDYYEVSNYAMVDLTERFGAGNEPTSTSDPRIKWLNHYLTKNPDYDEGSIVNAPVESIVSRGFNIWDEEWVEAGIDGQSGNQVPNDSVCSKNFIPVISGANYYARLIGHNIFIFEYDINKNYLGYRQVYEQAFTLKVNTYYIKFQASGTYGTTYNHDICINLSGTMNGTYLPYQAPSEYPIPAEVQALDGYGLGIDDTIYNYIDFERKKFVKKVGSYTFTGNETFSSLSYGRCYFSFEDIVKEPADRQTPANMVCNLFTNVADNAVEQGGMQISYYYGHIAFCLEETENDGDVEALRAYLRNHQTTIVFELATPVETDISEYLDRDFPNENLIDTYQGGEVEFENENDMGVPYSLTYQYKVE